MIPPRSTTKVPSALCSRQQKLCRIGFAGHSAYARGYEKILPSFCRYPAPLVVEELLSGYTVGPFGCTFGGRGFDAVIRSGRSVILPVYKSSSNAKLNRRTPGHLRLMR